MNYCQLSDRLRKYSSTHPRRLLCMDTLSRTVIYQTENGIFRFSFSDVIEKFTSYSDEFKTGEAVQLEKFLTSSNDNPIFIPEKESYFRLICLYLINENKGEVICRKCQKKYLSKQLKIIRRSGNLQTKEKQYGLIKFIKRLFFKEPQQRIGNFGEKCFECPEKHKLLSIITWIS